MQAVRPCKWGIKEACHFLCCHVTDVHPYRPDGPASVAFLLAQKRLTGAFAPSCASRCAGYIPVGCLDGMQEG